MEMFVFIAGLLLCLILSVAITLFIVQKVNKCHLIMVVVLLPTLMAVLGVLYNNVMQEYFIGKRVTFEQLCTEVSVATLYFK